MRTTLGGAVTYYTQNDPRGEYVLVVEGSSEQKPSEAVDLCSLSVEQHVDYYMSSGMSKKDAIKAVAKDRGVPKNDIYMLFVNE
jgi:16S rRNA (cytidine1402-2'-O)-methyltransferase